MTKDEINQFFRGLRALRDKCRHDISSDDRIAILIVACIDVGFNTKPQIIGALDRLGFTKIRVIKALEKFEGGQWRQQGNGAYTSLA